ncbi:hypothetical protein BDZ89DRAFT_2672 [Hymenopellis radicata]|nr:hypothetical protein BDZ89DRAFT_2672 [Hymenopellis radicata]
MRFFTVLTTLAAVSVASASTAASTATLTLELSATLNEENCYGAPTPPWEAGCKPGWYYGDFPNTLENVCVWLKDSLICELLDLLPLCMHCPNPVQEPPKEPSKPCKGTNYKCAVQADDYLTYGLVDTIKDCDTMCKGVKGCGFYNTYHDNNAKDGSTKLTCALFKYCHGSKDADNCGGQTQKNGSQNYITESQGFCLNK